VVVVVPPEANTVAFLPLKLSIEIEEFEVKNGEVGDKVTVAAKYLTSVLFNVVFAVGDFPISAFISPILIVPIGVVISLII
jgi:hypothetical protein